MEAVGGEGGGEGVEKGRAGADGDEGAHVEAAFGGVPVVFAAGAGHDENGGGELSVAGGGGVVAGEGHGGHGGETEG